jgi:hypothetical protein
MRTRRQFQPFVDALPYRIAPSSLVVAPAVSLVATPPPPASGITLTMSPGDTDMPETGTSAPIIAAPPPSGGTGTLIC